MFRQRLIVKQHTCPDVVVKHSLVKIHVLIDEHTTSARKLGVLTLSKHALLKQHTCTHVTNTLARQKTTSAPVLANTHSSNNIHAHTLPTH